MNNLFWKYENLILYRICKFHLSFCMLFWCFFSLSTCGCQISADFEISERHRFSEGLKKSLFFESFIKLDCQLPEMHSIPSKYFHSYYMTIRFLRNLRSLIFLIFLFLLVCFHVMLMTLYQLWALHFACHIRMSHAKSIHFLSIIYLSGSTRQLDRRLLLRVLTSLYIAD